MPRDIWSEVSLPLWVFEKFGMIAPTWIKIEANNLPPPFGQYQIHQICLAFTDLSKDSNED